MQKYECDVCGYIYKPEQGEEAANIAAGTSFEALDAGYQCPLCGAGKSDFTPVN